MNNVFQNNFLYDADIKIIEQSEHCTVYEMKNDEGTGMITSYQVFPGIQLAYNDFHMGTCPHHSFLHKDIIEINHCREGRFECEFINGMYTYLSEGDLAVNTLVNSRGTNATFPLKHYHGVSILIDLEEASNMISTVLQDISIDLYALRDKLCADDRCFIVRAKDSIQHIFSELYTIPDEVKHGYFKLKVLELLLFLSIIDASEPFEKRPYFPKSQVNKIKQIKQFLTQNIACHFTLEELSKRFGISLTAMNSCFKAVYGIPVYAFIRTYRMQAAAAMLLTSQDSITVIAGNVGYENSSKFASAFKAVIHISPSAYRKSH
ncbi:helix-turn-helix domain-containing protein [Sporomusa acidovorans]|uniref:HTH-type transcriptional activator RhaR n=1 Tax=Sporomusa acidovorans (strain ATCC 49682 / DSM 3132 / Mol) TaxID=1123286 RepID=A0ABZ3IYV0_SPOA4|nr:AraC family transcriptional regulator [Sporomusa acidovorans]OZC17713.1 regulatory protein PchR [Sporomusa acidovorans DSM 3132]SDE12823.1 AraC-type DNA-binding protein [Sporomusa acidovorans]